MADKVHDVHQSPDGKYRWVEGTPGFYKHAQQFFGGPRDVHPSEVAEAEHVPLNMVVLRCRCDDPKSHAEKGQHCPKAEIDVADSYAVSIDFVNGQNQGGQNP